MDNVRDSVLHQMSGQGCSDSNDVTSANNFFGNALPKECINLPKVVLGFQTIKFAGVFYIFLEEKRIFAFFIQEICV